MNPATLRELGRADPVMAGLIRAAGPCTIRAQRGRPPYQALMRSVAYQQLHGKAAATIFGRFLALYPGVPHPTPAQVLATPDETLRGAGFSRSKVAALRDIAARTLDGTVPDRRAIARLDDAAIIERLTVVRGVGRWTVEMLLMFTLARPDVLPVDDFGVRQGFKLAYGRRQMPTPKALRNFAARWAPYRTTAAWYLWRAVDLHRAGRLPAPPSRTRLE